MIQLILSRTELNFGILLLVMLEDQYPKIFHEYDYNADGLDETVRGWSAENFLREEKYKSYWIYTEVNDSEINSNI